MIIKNGKFYLEDIISINSKDNSIEYADIDNNKIIIHHKLVFDLYNFIKFEKERKGINLEEYKKQLYAKD